MKPWNSLFSSERYDPLLKTQLFRLMFMYSRLNLTSFILLCFHHVFIASLLNFSLIYFVRSLSCLTLIIAQHAGQLSSLKCAIKVNFLKPSSAEKLPSAGEELGVVRCVFWRVSRHLVVCTRPSRSAPPASVSWTASARPPSSPRVAPARPAPPRCGRLPEQILPDVLTVCCGFLFFVHFKRDQI